MSCLSVVEPVGAYIGSDVGADLCCGPRRVPSQRQSSRQQYHTQRAQLLRQLLQVPEHLHDADITETVSVANLSVGRLQRGVATHVKERRALHPRSTDVSETSVTTAQDESDITRLAHRGKNF